VSTRVDQKQQTRRKLIEAAIRLSAERGFSAVSLREITTAAGITPAAFYRHFRDMNDLGLALIDEVGLGLRQLLREARGSFMGVKQGTVRASIETFLKFVTDNPNLFRVLLGERQGSSTEYRKALQSEIARFIDDFTDDIERWSQAAHQPMAETALAAEAIVTVVFTVGAEAIELPRHKRGELAERLIKEVKMILRGARATYEKTVSRSTQPPRGAERRRAARS
jgi:AcrR family transcriptional regulator